MTSVVAAKAALRKEIKRVLGSLSLEEKKLQSKTVQSKLFQHEIYQRSKRLSIFLSMNDEIQTEPILKNALEAGKACYIPRLVRFSICNCIASIK